MKVKISITSTDMEGNDISMETIALMTESENGYKLSYVERLSEDSENTKTGEGTKNSESAKTDENTRVSEKTKTTMFLTSKTVRIRREGEVISDFIYSKDMTHNSVYQTPYGNFPVVVTTNRFEFTDKNQPLSKDDFENHSEAYSSPGDIDMNYDIEYDLVLQGAEAITMKVSIKVCGI